MRSPRIRGIFTPASLVDDTQHSCKHIFGSEESFDILFKSDQYAFNSLYISRLQSPYFLTTLNQHSHDSTTQLSQFLCRGFRSVVSKAVDSLRIFGIAC